MIISIVILLVFGIQTTYSNEAKFGACPEPDVVKNLNYEKLMGVWYVIEQSYTNSTCITMRFEKDPQGNLTVVESSRPVGVNMTTDKFRQIGELRIPDTQTPAKMTVKFAFTTVAVPYSDIDFWIMDTDYDNYLAIWCCKMVYEGHRQSAIILSRVKTLSENIINKLKEKFEFHNVDERTLIAINHNECQIKPNPTSTEVSVQTEIVTVTVTEIHQHPVDSSSSQQQTVSLSVSLSFPHYGTNSQNYPGSSSSPNYYATNSQNYPVSSSIPNYYATNSQHYTVSWSTVPHYYSTNYPVSSSIPNYYSTNSQYYTYHYTYSQEKTMSDYTYYHTHHYTHYHTYYHTN